MIAWQFEFKDEDITSTLLNGSLNTQEDCLKYCEKYVFINTMSTYNNGNIPCIHNLPTKTHKRQYYMTSSLVSIRTSEAIML